MTTTEFHLCSDCAKERTEGVDSPARSPENFSTENEWLENVASRDASIEVMGDAAHAGTRDIGCFTCFVCDDIDYGQAHIFEGEEKG
ncbi:hypothetical protein [Nocardia jiangxiensis]|uniref:hypothetical protein n=1 Tax=Nocardia jiangxiensis TaxID=282685 RepID=UPI000592BF63|nr:hypothetical protein [Nocardia jiangxiensis]